MRGFAISDSPVFQSVKTARLSNGYDVVATPALNGDSEPIVLINLNNESLVKALAGGPWENTIGFDGQPYTYDHVDPLTNNVVFVLGDGPTMNSEYRTKLAELGKQLERLIESNKTASDIQEGDEHIDTFENEGGSVASLLHDASAVFSDVPPNGPFLDGRYWHNNATDRYIYVANGNVVGIASVPPLLFQLNVEIGNGVLRSLLAETPVNYAPYPETTDGVWANPTVSEQWVRTRNGKIVAYNDGHSVHPGDEQYLKYLISTGFAVLASQNDVRNYPTGAEGEPLQQVGEFSSSCR